MAFIIGPCLQVTALNFDLTFLSNVRATWKHKPNTPFPLLLPFAHGVYPSNLIKLKQVESFFKGWISFGLYGSMLHTLNGLFTHVPCKFIRYLKSATIDAVIYKQNGLLYYQYPEVDQLSP